jgi:hypothetical protein
MTDVFLEDFVKVDTNGEIEFDSIVNREKIIVEMYKDTVFKEIMWRSHLIAIFLFGNDYMELYNCVILKKSTKVPNDIIDKIIDNLKKHCISNINFPTNIFEYYPKIKIPKTSVLEMNRRTELILQRANESYESSVNKFINFLNEFKNSTQTFDDYMNLKNKIEEIHQTLPIFNMLSYA